MIFNALSEKAFIQAVNRHDEVSAADAVKCCTSHQTDGYMVPKGSRVPNGGRKGDGYVPYASITTETSEHVKRLFHHAIVSYFQF